MAVKKKTAKKKVAKKSATSNRFPKTVGGIVDAIFKQDQVIRDLNNQLSAAKQKREDMVEHAFSTFQNEKLEGGRGKLATGTISRTEVPSVEDPQDWDKVFRYILKSKDFSVLQKRLGVTHIRDLWNDGIKIPGVGKFTKVSLSVRKVKAK